ncbi:MAG: PHP domain-containing protein [Clostridiales bacterium]|nr:PHP domain-containing protein [Clostridiales bacterium]
MTGYLYETHLHTVEASKCGKVHGEDYIPYLIDKGYSGMIVTDHFLNGNTCIPLDLPWEEKIDIYCSGYERALAAATGTDFLVMFGVEFNFGRDEYLLYGIDREWLLAHEDIMHMTRRELYETIHEAGGLMIQAHPFRERDYLSDIKLSPHYCDGIEVYNAANKPNMNALAYEYALSLGKPMTAGSDLHFFHDNDKGAMCFSTRLEGISDYVARVRNHEGVPVIVRPDGSYVPVAESREMTVSIASPMHPVLYPEG